MLFKNFFSNEMELASASILVINSTGGDKINRSMPAECSLSVIGC